MNSAASQKTYMKMQNKIVRDSHAICMLVEVVATKSQNKTWVVTVDKEQFNNDHIRRVSIDKFYEIVFGDPLAFVKLCKALPLILDDVIEELGSATNQNTVFSELAAISPNIMKSLYLLAFKTYDGFDNF